MLARLTRLRVWGFAAVYLLLNALALAVFRAHAEEVAAPFTLLAALAAVACAVMRVRREQERQLKVLFGLAAVSFAVWGIAYLLMFIEEMAHWTTVGQVLFFMYGVPVLMMAGSRLDARWGSAIQWLDSGLVLVLGFAAYTAIYDAIPMSGQPLRAMPNSTLVIIFDALAFVMMVPVLLRWLAAPAGSRSRQFFSKMAAFLVVRTVCVIAVNAQSGDGPEGVTDMLDTLPLVLFAVMTYTGAPRTLERLVTVETPTLAPVLDNAVPFLVPAGAVLGSVWMGARHPMGAVAAGMAVMLLYGARSTLVQMAFQQARSEAFTARDAMHALSLTDELTGVPNRRAFDQRLRREWAHLEPMDAPLSLLMVDIDHFKMVNDQFGHADGDVCLRQVAHALAAALQRELDTVARIGGEEFAAILPNADLQGALQVAKRMHQVVAQLRFRNCSPIGEVVTISIGVSSCVPGSGMNAAMLLDAADAALYAAKSGGRNCTVVRLPETDEVPAETVSETVAVA